ncbi:MAG: hypothetical protein HY295_05665 [Thaumarchaeota archaeon]|nr:hypothetical protein [Nitrososphaerota archaeon]
MPIKGIMQFRSLEELQKMIDGQLGNLVKATEDYSKIIGEKLRGSETNNDTSLAELKEKLNTTTDSKKKKPVKKDKRANWHSFGNISVFDGIGVKGELELYFKAMDDMKLRAENLQKIKESVDGLISKGIKNDLGCIAFLPSYQSPLDLVFVHYDAQKNAKFSFKSIFNVGIEHERLIEIH